MPTITSFDGVSVGPATAYDLDFSAASDYDWSADLSLQSRFGDTPISEGFTSQPVTRLLRIRPGSAAPADMDEWRQNAIRLFRPGPLVPLRASHRGTAIEVPAAITRTTHPTSLPMRSDRNGLLFSELSIPDPIWYTVAEAGPVTASPITVGGNYPAAPRLVITPTGTAGRRIRATITDTTGRGLQDYPIRLTVDTSGLGVTAANQIILFHMGRPIPFLAQGYGTATTLIDTRVTCRAGQSAPIDVIAGSGVNNTITAQALNPAGMDLAHASHTNTTWVYRNTAGTIEGKYAPAIWDLMRAPKATGVWHLETIPTSSHQATVNAASVVFAPSPARHDAVVVVTQVEMAATNALQGFESIVAVTLVAAEPWYLRPGDVQWSTTTGAAPGGPFQAPGAIAAAFTGELTANATSLAVSASPPMRINLDAAKVPTIAYAAPVNCWPVTFTLTNTTNGRTLSMSDVYADGAITVDTLGRGFTWTGVHYWSNPDGGISHSGRGDWWPLDDGVANAYTLTAGYSLSAYVRDRFAI